MPGYANPQNLNRYSYVTNNPLRYTDPTGHMLSENEHGGGCSTSGYCPGSTTPQAPSNPGGGGNDDDDDNNNPPGGGGSQPSPSPDLSPDEQVTDCTLNQAGGFDSCLLILPPSPYSIPLLPPSPYACGWFDCALSAVSLIASGVTMTGVPEYVAVAFVVDLAATAVAVIRTNEDYAQGEITRINQVALNGTAVFGLLPGPAGFGFSVVNTIITFSGFPPYP